VQNGVFVQSPLRRQRKEILSGLTRYTLEDDDSCGGCVHNQLVQHKDGDLIKVSELRRLK
jgi:hypothetical protein